MHVKPLLIAALVSLFISSCAVSPKLQLPAPATKRVGGTDFYKSIFAVPRQAREEAAVKQIMSGNIPAFLKKFVRIETSIITADGKKINAHYYVLPDYLSIGNEDDFARIPLTPMAAKLIADSIHCFLPTTKMVDQIYNAAKVKLEPIPMYAFRDSAVTMYQHHLIIEGQRKLRKGLIAGIKKDVVTTSKLEKDNTPNKVAIYGWHKTDGRPIQPLYTGHVNWYVDYSHGIRLVYRTIYVHNKAYDYTEILNDPTLRALLTDEAM